MFIGSVRDMMLRMPGRTVQPFYDSGCTVTGLRLLFTSDGAELLRAVEDQSAKSSEIEPRQIKQLRKHWSQDAVQAALAVVHAQKKAASAGGKFPTALSGSRIWAVPEALQQATSRRVAEHKAEKFRQFSPTMIIDFCCGIGGDMLALADIAPVLAVELSEVRAFLAARNAIDIPHRRPVLIIQADAAASFYHPQPGMMFHIDPARRSGGLRSAAFSAMHPGPAVIQKTICSLNDGAIKLSPAVAFSDLPPGHLELISEDGVVVQAVLWTGCIAEQVGLHTRTATVLPRQGATWSLTDKPATVDLLHEPQQWVFEINGAVLRAGLAAALCRRLDIRIISADGGYASGMEFINHPALTGFRIRKILAYSERAVVEALKTDASANRLERKTFVEVKTRGGLDLNTDKLTKAWSAIAAQNYTILVYRAARGARAIIAERKTSD
jgi:hypothetical protein